MRVLRFLLGLSTRVKIIIALLVVAMGIFVIAYFEPHKLFIDEEVNEDFPAPVAVATTTTAAPPVTDAPTTTEPATNTTEPATTAATAPEESPDEDAQTTTTAPSAEEPTTTITVPPTTTSTTAAPVTTTTTEAVPEGPVLLSSSEWISLGHPGTGTVLVYRQPDGSHVIRFQDLAVSNGPDLLVILSASPLVNDRNAYSEVEYVSLGDLKGNKGNQNYVVPAEVNIGDYQTVAIWCRRFNYTFNAAELHSPPA